MYIYVCVILCIYMYKLIFYCIYMFFLICSYTHISCVCACVCVCVSSMCVRHACVTRMRVMCVCVCHACTCHVCVCVMRWCHIGVCALCTVVLCVSARCGQQKKRQMMSHICATGKVRFKKKRPRFCQANDTIRNDAPQLCFKNRKYAIRYEKK